MKFNRFSLIFAVFFVIAISPALGITDTVYVQKRITDTLYVVSPPDTVYIQEAGIQANSDNVQHFESHNNNNEMSEANAATENNAKPLKNEYITEYSTDTIPPANKFYIGATTGLTLFSIWFGAPMFDFDYEIENSYRGSLMFNLSSIILFYEYTRTGDDPTWEGFRSIFSPGIGYRQYYLTFTTTKVNPKKHPVKFRNTPLNSISFYIQTMASPAFKIAYDKKYKSADPKKGSIDVGIAPSATLGMAWNAENMLWSFGFIVGYQYWGDNSRKYLKYLTHDPYREKMTYRFMNGWCAKGLFFGTDAKIGF
ncbi:MAG: hypothetical protein SPL52_03370 [Fibrobacter sp.]|nr:hypothetical protein [Fibrobacter sp.]